MKWDCDWKLKWHRHFCWFPTRIAEHDCRWLETVERQRRYMTDAYEVMSLPYYVYRELS